MKRASILVAILLGSSLFFTSCEKEYLNLPGNSTQNNNSHRDGEAEDNDGIDDEEDDDLDGITDGGRDEDYDKSGKSKKPKAN